MATLSRDKKLARIRGRKRWDMVLAAVSAAVLLLVAFILLKLAKCFSGCRSIVETRRGHPRYNLSQC